VYKRQQLLRSNGTTNAYTTSTYPDTNAVNTLLYASSANNMAALATANSSVLVTSAGGVPSLSTTLPNINIGTPSAGVLTNCTGFPISGTTGYGTGVATALAVNTNSTGGFAVETDSTFTPVMAFGGASTGVTYTVQTGYYTRIGNTVTFAISILLSSKGSSTGAATITGLPVASRAGPVDIYFTVGCTNLSFVNAPISAIDGGTSVLKIFFNFSRTVLTQATDTNFTNNTGIYITGTYLV